MAGPILLSVVIFHSSFSPECVITSVIAAYVDEDSVERRYGDKYKIESINLNPRIRENREQLKSIIKYLNGRIDDRYESKMRNNILNDLVSKDPYIENDNLVDEQEARILAALSLLQKNYNYQLRHGNDDKRSRSRLFYIENPEVVEEFKSNQRSFLPGTSSESTDDDSEFERILSHELSGHRKFDMIGPSKDKNAVRPHNHGHLRSHKNRNPDRGDAELKNGNSYKNVHQKGRFKIANDKRKGQTIEGKRKRPVEKNSDDQQRKVSDEHLDTNNHKYDRKEKIAANVVFKEITKDRDIPNRPKYSEKKYPRDDVFDTLIRDEEPYKRKRRLPKEHSLNKWGGIKSQALGRTFIPYIATKTVYEDD